MQHDERRCSANVVMGDRTNNSTDAVLGDRTNNNTDAVGGTSVIDAVKDQSDKG